VIDHINGDKLDNRRANLRSVTQKKNVWNRHHPPMSASGFYSVYRKRNKWVIAIGKDYRQVSIAGWLSCIVASFFADDVKRSLHGKYATVNYTRVVYTDELRDLLDSTCGTFFRVAFSKRSDGRLRVMHCRTGVKKGTVGGQMSFRPEEKNLYIVYDMDCRSHKAIPLERVLSLRICKENIKVIQRGLSWAS